MLVMRRHDGFLWMGCLLALLSYLLIMDSIFNNWVESVHFFNTYAPLLYIWEELDFICDI